MNEAPLTESRLELSDVAIAVAGRRLLAGIRLHLAPGELVGLAGPSGCGKTTLLRAVAGLIDPADGCIELSGKTGDELGWPAFRRRVVLVSQQPALHEDTVESCLRRPFRYRSAKNTFNAERAHTLLSELGLGSFDFGQSVRDFSVGERQRLCLARALLVEPDVLLLDEPTSALDAANVASAEMAITKATAERGLCALIVTHDMQQAQRWCDRVCDLSSFLPAEEGNA